jgi:hypothetical protein
VNLGRVDLAALVAVMMMSLATKSLSRSVEIRAALDRLAAQESIGDAAEYDEHAACRAAAHMLGAGLGNLAQGLRTQSGCFRW